ncbi:hypothetical protein [Streptomyces chartreusis]|uniref:hypothetical protein n=1 Tax=Streptomyces chartreusis TaxID=1969 RepID=UPI00123DB484|nr:hypothetical protein [Streptomyces chartreusis]QEV71881.1 hypothetical protein CP983_38050 [Streptomyces chartreusis]GGX22617.1 hypothetical protein GCM10010321_41470 [Streptomyces chartreusis]
MSDADGAPVPDFLDRLIARHAPAATGPRPDVVRVRPRLPGPFERVEAVRSTAPEEDEGSGLLWPATTPEAARPGEAPRPAAPAARTHTERERTVVHTERTPADPAPRPAALPEVPLLRPVAAVEPGALSAPEAVPRAAGRGRSERGATRSAASTPIPPGAEAATPAAVSTPLRPSAADTAAARDAVRQAVARRPGKAPEQVVQVQIGRLEVTAGPAPSGGGRQRTPAPGRAGATVSLADYLARGRE